MGWTYEYVEEQRGDGWGWNPKALLRPVVPVRLAGAEFASNLYLALVDSGSDHVLAPEWVARLAGVDPDPSREGHIRIAGAARRIRFGDVELHLCAPASQLGEAEPEVVASWHTQVGFFTDWSDPPYNVVLGQCGFFDEFSVVMSRHSQRLTIETRDFHDQRYPPGVVTGGGPRAEPRFRP